MAEQPSVSVLIVDDSPENITLLSRILKMSGYLIEVARNGLQAIEISRSRQPDLILMDVNMPEMDGFETCSRLKQDELTNQIPIIFISALDNIEEKTKAFHLGGVDYILKPFDYEEVQARVETHLVLRNLRVQLEHANTTLAARVNELTISREKLAERERRLSAFVSALPNLSIIMDERGRYLEVISNEPGLLFARPEAMLGNLVEDMLPPQQAAKILDAIQQTIQTGQIQSIDYKIPVESGSERWFEGRIALMQKDASGHSKVILMATDTTERVQLYQEVQRLAEMDGLTGCFNRRKFLEKAADEIQRYRRYKNELSLLMIDIDRFKKVNDRYGHQAGDEILCNLVLTCKQQLRSTDVLGRYGGEEFLVLLPETGKQGARQAAERLRDKIEKMEIETHEGSLSVTVSIGITSLERGFDESKTLDLLIKSADKALYAAKKAGRNCIRVG